MPYTKDFILISLIDKALITTRKETNMVIIHQMNRLFSKSPYEFAMRCTKINLN